MNQVGDYVPPIFNKEPNLILVFWGKGLVFSTFYGVGLGG